MRHHLAFDGRCMLPCWIRPKRRRTDDGDFIQSLQQMRQKQAQAEASRHEWPSRSVLLSISVSVSVSLALPLAFSSSVCLCAGAVEDRSDEREDERIVGSRNPVLELQPLSAVNKQGDQGGASRGWKKEGERIYLPSPTEWLRLPAPVRAPLPPALIAPASCRTPQPPPEADAQVTSPTLARQLDLVLLVDAFQASRAKPRVSR
eukprot:756697-Hanusia_phi.AAC.2